jgi:transposase
VAQTAPIHVVVEATGGFEEVGTEECERQGIRYSVVHPLRVRQFSKSIGRLAKTDRVDARVLAEFGRAVRPRPTRP